MSTVTVRYYEEPEGWWAEADALPTFSAAGASYAEVRSRVLSALPDLLGEPVEILEDLSAAGVTVPVVYAPTGRPRNPIWVRSALTGHGPSFARGPVSIGVGKFEPSASALNNPSREVFG